MRSSLTPRLAHTRRFTQKVFFTFMIMLAMVGGILSLSAFTFASSTPLSSHASHRLVVPDVGCKPSFPADAVFRWNNSFYQAWIRPIEGGDKHFNFAIQDCGPSGPGSYVINAHVRYTGSDLWETSDSVSGTVLYWGAAGQGLCNSYYTAVPDVVGYVANTIGNGSNDLYNNSYVVVAELMDLQIGNVC